ncbi:ABC transporter permease subunit [Nonomuraea sp. NPDC050478]|uniref:ABC transporter permease subunit n=1 Tax=Nonomuraea sp. NPDC050478 TaxID=3364365 RepID=UPI0037B64343
MTRYVLFRAGQAVLVLWAAFTAAYVLLRLLPGDSILIKFQNPELGLSPQQIAEIRAHYDGGASALATYLDTLSGFLRGSLGYSIDTGTPVTERLAEALPETARLASAGFGLAVLIAVAIAFAAASSRSSWIRGALLSVPSLFVSVPVFWLGILLIQVFSFRLGLVPVIGGSAAQQLILPVLTLAVPISAPIAQVLARAVDQVRAQPFVPVVAAKGASRQWILWRHVARNATLPALTMAGLVFGELIAGSVVTETVFGRNGIGRLTEQAVNAQDTPVMLAVVVLAAVGLLLGTLLGVLAGSAGGLADDAVMRLVDVLLSVPGLLLALTVIILLGPGTVNVAIAVGVGSVAAFARLTRSEVVRVRRTDYVEAAFGSGGRYPAVLWRHVLPNSLGPVVALAALQFGLAILAISTLGFLGYGAEPPTPEWGLLIAEGRNYLATSWWLTTLPGAVVVAVVLAAGRISRSIGKDTP